MCYLSLLQHLALAVSVTTKVKYATRSILVYVYANVFPCMQTDISCGSSQYLKKGKDDSNICLKRGSF